MRKCRMSAPLPFVGQKRRFAGKFIDVLKRYDDKTVFVDLFGGSGLLSHITKSQRPDATVVYNDYDNFRLRLEAIPATNRLLNDLRAILHHVPRKAIISEEDKRLVMERIKKEEQKLGFVDYITLSTSLLFSMKYVVNYEDLEKETLYNRIKRIDYDECPEYLEGLTITSCDYRALFEKYKDIPNVVFLIDPPYLNTDTSTYKMSWKLSDYLDVLNVLKGSNFIYFTSDKSSVLELCEWIGKNYDGGNPFANCQRQEFKAQLNYNSGYTDIMIYT